MNKFKTIRAILAVIDIGIAGVLLLNVFKLISIGMVLKSVCYFIFFSTMILSAMLRKEDNPKSSTGQRDIKNNKQAD